jgi:hypothetical protein
MRSSMINRVLYTWNCIALKRKISNPSSRIDRYLGHGSLTAKE